MFIDFQDDVISQLELGCIFSYVSADSDEERAPDVSYGYIIKEHPNGLSHVFNFRIVNIETNTAWNESFNSIQTLRNTLSADETIKIINVLPPNKIKIGRH